MLAALSRRTIARKQIDAIRTHRQLLDATDPGALGQDLTDTLRHLNNAHTAHEKAYTEGLASSTATRPGSSLPKISV